MEHVHCILFADDTTIYCSSNNLLTLRNGIEKDMNSSLTGSVQINYPTTYQNKVLLNKQMNEFIH